MASENTQTQDNSLIATTRALLDDALTRFEKGTIAVSFSGAEDVVLIDPVSYTHLTLPTTPYV